MSSKAGPTGLTAGPWPGALLAKRSPIVVGALSAPAGTVMDAPKIDLRSGVT